jgi:hypothetical protein
VATLRPVLAGRAGPPAPASPGAPAVAPPDVRTPVLMVAAVAAVILTTALAFPGSGPIPFPWAGLALTEMFCFFLASGWLPTPRVVRIGAAMYGVASMASFVVANPVGGNAPRLACSVGIPVLACYLGPRLSTFANRRLAVGAVLAVIVPFVVWQWAPGRLVTTPGADPAIDQAFYQPLLTELAAVSPAPARTEIPPTKEHWEAAYVADQFPLARGWERQLDIADNPIFYRPGALSPTSYAKWLAANGISWVALPHTPLDYAGKAEGSLLASGRVPGLTPVWSDANWQLWRVDGSPGLVSGPAKLTGLGPDQLTLDVHRPGSVTVRVRYTSYWSVGDAAACVTEDAAGWTVVTARTAGVVQLTAKLVGGREPASCPSS